MSLGKRIDDLEFVLVPEQTGSVYLFVYKHWMTLVQWPDPEAVRRKEAALLASWIVRTEFEDGQAYNLWYMGLPRGGPVTGATDFYIWFNGPFVPAWTTGAEVWPMAEIQKIKSEFAAAS